MNKTTAWRSSRLRRVLSKHLLDQLKASTQNSQTLTKQFNQL